MLPGVIERFDRLPDPRRVASCRHRLTVLLVYAILLFLWQFASRRAANQALSRPTAWEALRQVFPMLDTVPHTDTIARVLERLDPAEVEAVLLETIRRLLRKRKFRHWLGQRRYLVAIDGSQKWSHDTPWTPAALHRKTGSDTTSYPVYVVEAILTGPQGVSIPLLAEFCENAADAEPETKQDCELKAFYRLAARLKATFPHMPLCVLRDGLYPNGPLMALCRQYHWDFLIVLQDGNLPEFQAEAHGLHKLLPEQPRQSRWGDRPQTFWWVNQIPYEWRDAETGGRRHLVVHYVVCEERWMEQDELRHRRWVWVSGQPLTAQNVVARCNDMARCRWDIEEHILVEKHRGYHYEHLYSQQWNAIKNWHTVMRLAHLLNVLILGSVALL